MGNSHITKLQKKAVSRKETTFFKMYMRLIESKFSLIINFQIFKTNDYMQNNDCQAFMKF